MKKPEPEFSRPVDAAKLGRSYHLVANPVELAALARRLGLVALEQLEADLELRRGQGGTIAVRGNMRAKVVQSCVVTLEPVEAVLEEQIDSLFSEQSGPEAAEDLDAPEPVENGKIDLGETVTQYLSLALNPYPRKPGASFAGYL